jgi:hypothetical protein
MGWFNPQFQIEPFPRFRSIADILPLGSAKYFGPNSILINSLACLKLSRMDTSVPLSLGGFSCLAFGARIEICTQR